MISNENIPVANIASPRNDTSSVIEVAEIAPHGIEVVEIAYPSIIVAEAVSTEDISGNPVVLNTSAYRRGDSALLSPNYNNNYNVLIPILKIRKGIIEFFWATLIFSMINFFINPFSMALAPILVLNMWALKVMTRKIIKSVIASNIITIFLILLSNIFISTNISNLSKFFISGSDDRYKVIIIYMPMLFLTTVIVIGIYIYFIHNFFKLSVLHRSLNNEQRRLLYELFN